MTLISHKGHPLEEDKFVDVGECESTKVPISICYNAFGDPNNPCVLLINGLGSTLLAWRREFCDLLVCKGYYVIRCDNRDIGLSTHLNSNIPPSPMRFLLAPRFLGERKPFYSLEDMGKDAVGVLKALGIKKAHIVGASMGGMIAQCVAIHFPEYVQSLTIIYSHAGGPHTTKPSWGETLGFLRGPNSSKFDDVVAFKVQRRKRVFGRYWVPDEQVKEEVLKSLHRSPEDNLGVQRQMWAIAGAKSRENELKKISAPTLIIHGNEDKLVPFQNSLVMLSLIPDSVLVIYPGMKHYMPKELDEDITCKMVLNFRKGSA